MSKPDQLLDDLNYLEDAGMSVEHLRALHHWAGKPTETNVTYASVRAYFKKGQDMRANNSAFAERLHIVSDAYKRGFPALVDIALRLHPSDST